MKTDYRTKLSLFSFLLSFSIASPLLAATFTVTNTADSGAGSLRQAIMDANANPGTDLIDFNINSHSPGPHSIKVVPVSLGGLGPLPAIRDTVRIDGFTQAGAGVYAVEISGELFPDPATITPIVVPSLSSSGYPAGLIFWGRDRAKDVVSPYESLDGACKDASNTAGCKLAQNPDGSHIQGLIINRFPRQAIYLYGADNFTIVGNYFGLDATGQLPGFASGRIEIGTTITGNDELRVEASNNNFIGTTETDYLAGTIYTKNRNVFGSCGRACIAVLELNENVNGFAQCATAAFPAGCRHEELGSQKSIIQGNYLGLNKDGTSAVGGFCTNGRTPATATLTQPCTTADDHLSIRAAGMYFGAPSGKATVALSNAATLAAQNREHLIGGLKPGMGNVIAAITTRAIQCDSPKNQILGNIIGLNASESAIPNVPAALNGILVFRAAWDTLIQDNVISGANFGISFATFTNLPGPFNVRIRNNLIGINHAGVNVGNVNRGIYVAGDIRSTLIENNVVTNNGTGGILIQSQVQPFGMPAELPPTTVYSPKGISILNNSIHSNGGIGIDLNSTTTFSINTLGQSVGVAGDGVTLNDPLDVDTSVNNLQNFPILNAQKSFINPSLVQVWGSLDSKPNQDYRIQVFANLLADPSGYGEGQVLVGDVVVQTDVNGHVEFNFPAKLNSPSVGGVQASILTATATDLLTGDTSEFSPWVNVNIKANPTAYENASGAAGGDHGVAERFLE